VLKRIVIASLLVLGPAAEAAAQRSAPAPSVDTTLYAGMHWRMVGPFRGGRSTAVTGVAGQPNVFYMGSTGGGVWKTDDAGGHWTSLTDRFLDVGNIGAIDVADSDPRIIYVGTGSASLRGNVSVGRGVWKSTDAGATWRFLGLRESGAIGKLVIHPTDPNIVYVAAVGHPFGRNRERGVFRTRDGGATWQHVLALNDSTGAVTISMSPDNPDELYAGAWRAERKPWTMISGGPEGGVYKSTDGGDHWTKLGGGLPTGIVGKVAVHVSPADPEQVWALVEAEPGGGLYKSSDRGATWTLVNSEARIRARPFYFNHMRPHPTDTMQVFVMVQPLLRSMDGGRSFQQVPVPHGDVHDIWINPLHPEVFAISDDGGTVVTLNDGRTFSSMYNQPTAELYEVLVDNQTPYRLYGSQQDNTTISVLQRRLHNSLRPQQEWQLAGGCETGPIAVHPDHPEIVWGGCYGGLLNRMDLRNDTRVSVLISPESKAVAPAQQTNRFQWLAPLAVSPHEPNTLYYGSQYLYRSRNGGDDWERISPDLTTDDERYQQWPGGPITPDNSGVEVFTTLFAITPSPQERGTLWVGTDDGRVHITRDEGATWTDITPRDMPPLATVNRIEASTHAPGRAFVAAHRYRMDDFTPYAWRTDDYGRTWRRIADGRNGIPADHPLRVVREDPARRGLLYAGTEFGAFVSFDDGARWQPLQMNLPATPVTDIKVHRGDLAISTQGRSFWILDDVTPLRELADDASAGVLRVYTPRPAARGFINPPLGELEMVMPEDLPHGSLIQYVLTRDVPEVAVDVLDAGGRVVRSFRSDSAAAQVLGSQRLRTSRGFHRVVWDLRESGPRVRVVEEGEGGGGGGGGVKVPPGTYQVRVTAGGVTQTRPLVVTGNPRAPEITQADYEAQYAAAAAVRDTISAINDALVRMGLVATQAKAIVQRARSGGTEPGALAALADSLRARVAAVEGEVVPARPAGLAGEARLMTQYGALYNSLVGDGGYGAGSAEGRPPAGWMRRKAELDAQWTALRARLERVLADEVARFNAEAAARSLEGIRIPVVGTY
jgi:photosystem II stability/assembly factor-like uncharacterized protein